MRKGETKNISATFAEIEQ